MSDSSDSRASFWQADLATATLLPVAKPRLPTAARILPYLEQVDRAQWYSNGGGLVLEFEGRLARHCGKAEAQVATVANGTLGLTLALLAFDLPEGSLCMVPSWTFAATAHAILLAGLTPWMVDVSSKTWILEAEAARELLKRAPGQVGAVIPVSAFGAPLDLGPWQRFRAETGIAVVADAAAAFDTIRANEIPAVVSLHATKVCGIGEGGFVVSTDQAFIEEIRKRANFGFWNSRESTAPSFNGKLSEYGAAVGLASLDEWSETRADFLRVARAYRQNLAGHDDIQLQPAFGESWVSSTTVIESRSKDAETLTNLLTENGIGSRRWWGGGLHRHRRFQAYPRDHVAVTEALA
ncbi:MAG: DegT/DnrJ/EryC1/StrS family aminotransferase, partial [Verrucomicrobiota bacterium]|nr:DegT/DnrJ/EryC1/StrS family aminotransferase [Verrucomicrobiota bacterium]